MVPFFYDCGYQKGFAYAVMFHALLFMAMFMNFYRHTYNMKKSMTEAGRESSALKSNGAMMNGKQEQNGNVVKRKNGTVTHENAERRRISGKTE